MSKKAQIIPVVTNEEEAPLENEAQRLIRSYVIAATGTGFLRNSVISTSGIFIIQMMLIKDLCRLFGVSFNKDLVRATVNSVLGSVMTRGITSALTAIPGFSGSVKGLSGAGIAGVYVATIGEFYKVHFQQGGTLDDVTLGKIGRYFREEIQSGDISIQSIRNPLAIVKRLFG